MALNCSMISPKNEPIPLPGEKIFLSVESVTISLSPTTPGAGTTSESPISPTTATATMTGSTNDMKKKGKLPSISSILSTITSSSNPPPIDESANGTIYVTNQRILFISDDPAASNDPSHHDQINQDDSGRRIRIKTLTVPLRNSFDGRFVQPWLSPNYHLSTLKPVPNGQLDQLFPSIDPSNLQSNPNPRDSFTLKVIFHEGHGFEFYEALEEVKNIMFESETGRPADIEELPTYSPPSSKAAGLNNEIGSSTSEAGVNVNLTRVENGNTNHPTMDGSGPPSIDEPSSSLPNRRDTLPEHDLLIAASIATDQEIHERNLANHHEPPPTATSLEPPPPPPLSSNVLSSPNSDAPPGYEP